MENLAYPDDALCYECIDGKVYALARPMLRHSRVSSNIHHIFWSHLDGKPCETYQEVDVHLDEKNNVVPDVLIVCDPEKVKPDAVYGAPDLVVEILSPSTAKRDRKEKMHAYARAGVSEYWLVSCTERSVEVYYLMDGRFELDNVYQVYYDWQWKKLTDEEKEQVVFSFPVSIGEKFQVDVRDVFRGVE